MNALGNSSNRRLSISQRNAVEKLAKTEVQRQYDKEIDNAENFGKFFTTVAMCEVLEDEYHYDDKRRSDFMDKFIDHCNRLYDYIQSNTCTIGDSDEEVFDVDYNLEILNRYAERYNLKFDEGMIEY